MTNTRIYDMVQSLSSTMDELMDVVNDIEDYEALERFSCDIEELHGRIRKYITIWEKWKTKAKGENHG